MSRTYRAGIAWMSQFVPLVVGASAMGWMKVKRGLLLALASCIPRHQSTHISLKMYLPVSHN